MVTSARSAWAFTGPESAKNVRLERLALPRVRLANVGAATQGLSAGEFGELVRAIRAGATYVNVHTTGRPSGEIRAQLVDKDSDDD